MTELFGLPSTPSPHRARARARGARRRRRAGAARPRCSCRLSIRNVTRRRGRSALIVVGLMLGTTIITAALATGDTMSHTIRSTAVESLGQTDEVVSAERHRVEAPRSSARRRTARYFTSGVADGVASRAAGTGLVDGIAPGDRRARRGAGAGAAADRAAADALRDRPGPHGRLRRDPGGGRRRGLAGGPRPRRGLPRRGGRRRAATLAPGDVVASSPARRAAAPLRVRDGRALRRHRTGRRRRADAARGGAAPARAAGRRSGRCSCRTAATATSGAGATDQVIARCAPTARAARPRGGAREAGRDRRRRRRPAARSWRSSRRSARSRSPRASC